MNLRLASSKSAVMVAMSASARMDSGTAYMSQIQMNRQSRGDSCESLIIYPIPLCTRHHDELLEEAQRILAFANPPSELFG